MEKQPSRKRTIDLSEEIGQFINTAINFTKKDEEQRATAILKTRTISARQAEVFCNLSRVFRGAQYKLARVLIKRWAILEKKMHRIQVLSPFDDVELSLEAGLLIEASKFQPTKNTFWLELVKNNLKQKACIIKGQVFKFISGILQF